MTVVPQNLRTAAEATLLARMAERASATGRGPLAERGAVAAAAFARAGLPDRRVEEWKYTDLRRLMPEAWPAAGAADDAAVAAAPRPLAALNPLRLVIANGVFRPDLSDTLPAGAAVLPLREVLAAGRADIGSVATDLDNAPIALNTALASDGVVLEIAAGTALAQAIEIAHIAAADAPAAIVSRSFVRLGAGAKARVCETFAGPSAAQINALTEIVVGDGAELAFGRLQDEPAGTVNLSTYAARVGANAKFDFLNAALGVGLARTQLFAVLAGEHSHIGARGVTLVAGEQHADTTLVIDHAVPHCVSRDVFGTVIADRAKSVFQGLAVVRRGAQKTDAGMLTQALLLSEEGQFDTKPELEIYADDVACTHGATCGALDEDLLFYLHARGVAPTEAKTLLVIAFLAAATEDALDRPFAELALERAATWLRSRP